jgi:uroporphyrinogen-III synthase
LLRSRGHAVLILPLLRIESIPDPKLGTGPWAAALFTSAAAIRAIANHRRFSEIVALPAYVVGQRTGAEAVAAGFAPVLSADGDVDDLARLIASKLPSGGLPVPSPASGGGEVGRVPSQNVEAVVSRRSSSPASENLPLLYCAGEERAGDLAGVLREHGLQVDTLVVYRSVMETNLTPDVRAAFVAGTVDAVLHYSARTAAAFVAAVTAAGIGDLAIHIRHLCLSAQVAAPLVAAGAEAIEIAGAPNEQALLAGIGQA